MVQLIHPFGIIYFEFMIRHSRGMSNDAIAADLRPHSKYTIIDSLRNHRSNVFLGPDTAVFTNSNRNIM